MHPFPHCLGCRFPVYKYRAEFIKRREERFKKIGINGAYARANTERNAECGDIFDDLGVVNYCCRSAIMTGTNFDDDRYGAKSL